MIIACGMVWCRIVCRMARRPITSRRVPARVGDLHVSTMFTVGRAARSSSAMPRPNSACSRRRQRRFTNIYSFVWPWRSMTVQSAARLRRTVGPHLNPKSPCGTGSTNDSPISFSTYFQYVYFFS